MVLRCSPVARLGNDSYTIVVGGAADGDVRTATTGQDGDG
jgi:hypothetical protein